MMPEIAIASTDLARARSRLVSRRLPWFAAGWVAAMALWVGVFVLDGRLGPRGGTTFLAVQVAVLLGALARCRANPGAARVPGTVVAASIALGLSAITLAVAIGVAGDVLAFLLLTLYLGAALTFAWGWRAELTLLASTLVPAAAALPRIALQVSPLELGTAVLVGTVVALAVAEGAARSFRVALDRRWRADEATRSLQAAYDAYRDLAENARDYIWTMDLEARITYVNDAGARNFGRRPDELVGRPALAFITGHPKNPDLYEVVRAVSAGETLPPLMVEMAAAAGPRWYEIVVSAVRGSSDGRVVGIRGISRDVHERLRAEERLRASEARYRGLVESQLAAFVRFDPEGRLTYVNAFLCDVLGRSREELIGETFFPFVHPDDQPQVRAAMRVIQDTDEPRRVEERLLTPSGWRWFEWEGHAIRDAEGRIHEMQSVGRDIEDRKRAEEALRESEARYRGLVESQLQIVVRWDHGGNITFANEYWYRATGLERDQVLGRTMLHLVHPDDLGVVTDAMRAATVGGTRPLRQCRFRTAEGWRWYEWEGCAIVGKSGRIVEFQGVGRDVHERYVAQEALRASEARYRGLVESQEDVIVRFDASGRITFANGAYCRRFDRRPESVVGSNFRPLVHREYLDAVLAAIARLAAPPHRETVETRARTASGWCTFEWELGAVLGADGALVEIQAVGRDVTERRAAEEALRASETRYRSLVESQRELLVRLGPSGQVTFANEACEKLFGIGRDEMIGQTLPLIHEDDLPVVTAALERIRQPPYEAHLECREITPEGWRWIEWDGRAIHENGVLTEVQSVGRDVTEKRAAEEALHRSLEELRRSEEKLRQLALHQVAIREEERKRLGLDLHDDVCQELVGIGILIESIRRRVGPIAAEHAAEFERVARYLAQLVEHLRLLARDLRPLQLHDLGLEGSLRSLSAGMTSTSCQVSILFPTPIPRLDEAAEVGVYRVAQEALTNAIRHADARAIRVMLAVVDGKLRLEVSDDGRGFDPDDRAHALGLVSMEERALALGGRLGIWSQVGRGTTVRLECPLGSPESRAA